MNNSPLSWKENKHFNNYEIFPSQIRACIIGSSGCGKTKLMLKLLLQPGYLDYDTLVLCSPSLQQPEYQIIIKAFNANLNKQQVLNLFTYKKEIRDIDKALITLAQDEGSIHVIVYNHPEELPNPEDLNPTRKTKVLVVIDDCSIIKSDTPTKYFSYARPLNINLFYLSQTYAKVPKFIRENTNLFFIFKINNRTIKDVVFNEIGNNFDNDNEMISFLNKQIQSKHDFVIYNKDSDNWYGQDMSSNNVLASCNLIPYKSMTSVGSTHSYQLKQAEESLQAYRAVQNTLKNINDKKRFESSLYKQTKTMF